MTKPLVLCILDGVGLRKDTQQNAVKMANMPFFEKLFSEYPNTALAASGTAVGLPPYTVGNSEVGHITIGAGRIVNQFLRRFEIQAESGKLARNTRLCKFIDDVKSSGGIVHLLGLMSDGRVHSDILESIALARIVIDAGLCVRWHFIADGRDTSPKSAQKYAAQIQSDFDDELKDGRMTFATLCGRYYAMDRNNNWDRTQLAFDAISLGQSETHADNIVDAINAAYLRGESDEFIKPTIIGDATPIRPADGLLFTNYRADRARQILKAIAFPELSEIKRPADWTMPHILALSQYGMGLDEYIPALIPDISVKNTLGEVLAAAGKSQLRISETEKYNHVTYFFDAEKTDDYAGSEKILIPSPDVMTFDLQPEMSAAEITDALLPRLSEFDVIILNYANGDMVGHTGILSATIRAMETLNAQLSRLVPAVLALNGTILITADHGNAEEMWNDKANSPVTAHTANLVPFIVVSNEYKKIHKRNDAGLSDIAPTMLKILGIKKPAEMTGKSLI